MPDIYFNYSMGTTFLQRLSRFKSYSAVIIVALIFFILIYSLRPQYFFQAGLEQHYEPFHSTSFLEAAQNQTDKVAIWPEDFPNDDRILAQLSLTAPPDSPVKKIYMSQEDFYNLSYGDKIFIENNCNVQKCTFISDMANADAVLWKHRIHKSRKNVPPEQIWILFTLESPFHQGFVDYEGVVNWTATYRRDSDIVAPYAKWVYYDNNIRRFTNLTKNYADGKTNKVAMFVSNCNLQNNDRLKYAKTLNKYIPVDIYGRCGKDTCKRDKEKECFEMLRKSYKFYLAFENSNCRDYITEKFYLNGLRSDILPIVMGAYPDDYRAGPEHSYIHVDDFPSVEALAKYLHLLDNNDDLYNSYFEWKGTGEFIDTKFYCRLCAMLHNPRPKTYASFQQWWNGRGICPPKKSF